MSRDGLQPSDPDPDGAARRSGTERPRARDWAHDETERDACAIIANVKKDGRASHGNIAARANLKGFAFEYQTSGRGLVLGDPGPWLCSGMTGGVVHLLTDEELGLDAPALRRRLATGAQVRIEPVADADEANLRELLGHYAAALAESQQQTEAEEVARLAERWQERFVKVVPGK
ncbi:MAG TPA: hypothetical protein VK422_19335 [Pyrinomonadaceae bacterium]|nr:hypothetical protein [Pyrinomonadaceae bacterium]